MDAGILMMVLGAALVGGVLAYNSSVFKGWVVRESKIIDLKAEIERRGEVLKRQADALEALREEVRREKEKNLELDRAVSALRSEKNELENIIAEFDRFADSIKKFRAP